jgi:sortase A
MVRTIIFGALSSFERLLLFLGFLLILGFAAAHIYSAYYSHATLRAFWRSQSSSAPGPADLPHRNPAIPDFRLWSAKRIEAFQTSLSAPALPPLGVLRIPAIDLEVSVLEGTDDVTLNRAVGHIDSTAVPGEAGNVGIAGHRDGFFRGLKDVHPGDTIDLYTEMGNSRYVVDEIVIVPPEDVSVLAPRSKPALTLVTCYPFYFVGSAPLRYIVRAIITDPDNLANPGQPRSLAEEHGGQESH